MWHDLIRLMGRVYMAPASAGGGDGGSVGGGNGAGGSAGGAEAGTGAGTGAAGAGAAAGGEGGKAGAGEKSLLEQLGKGEGAAGEGGAASEGGDKGKGAESLTPEQRALAAAEKDTRRPQQVPSKYWNAEKGEVNYEAWAKSTNELETRMRTVGLPPKEASEYKFDVPKPMKDLGFDLDPVLTSGFRGKAHELGLTQKQYEGVMTQYFTHMPQMADQVKTFSADKARADLLGYYKTEDALTENVRNAFKVFSAFADEKDMELIDQIGNIPAVIRVLAKIWPEMAEDPGVNPDAIFDGESLEQLMRGAPGKEDSPYWNPEDPRHKAIMAKVMRHHEAAAAARQRKAA